MNIYIIKVIDPMLLYEIFHHTLAVFIREWLSSLSLWIIIYHRYVPRLVSLSLHHFKSWNAGPTRWLNR